MNDLFTVGEVARCVGVTPKTVRHYEAIGLLPRIRRGANGYRYFRLDDLNRLLFIQRAKVLGLSLDEIDELVQVAEDGHCARTRAELAEILADKLADCTRRIEELVAFREQIEADEQKLDDAENEHNASCCPSCAAFAPSCGCVPDLLTSTLR